MTRSASHTRCRSAANLSCLTSQAIARERFCADGPPVSYRHRWRGQRDALRLGRRISGAAWRADRWAGDASVCDARSCAGLWFARGHPVLCSPRSIRRFTLARSWLTAAFRGVALCSGCPEEGHRKRARKKQRCHGAHHVGNPARQCGGLLPASLKCKPA